MMLIFDSFRSRAAAEEFLEQISLNCELAGSVHDSQEESDKIDPFPFKLVPPIVLIERPDPSVFDDPDDVEDCVEQQVSQYGGKFAGT